jgi:hypothetical protein
MSAAMATMLATFTLFLVVHSPPQNRGEWFTVIASIAIVAALVLKGNYHG